VNAKLFLASFEGTLTLVLVKRSFKGRKWKANLWFWWCVWGLKEK
jgi:hypothetical protein